MESPFDKPILIVEHGEKLRTEDNARSSFVLQQERQLIKHLRSQGLLGRERNGEHSAALLCATRRD